MSLYQKLVSWVVLAIGKIHWRGKNELSATELDQVRKLLVPNYYVILTHRSNHLSTFFTSMMNFFLTGRWGYWAHALMNMEDSVHADTDFRLVEAVSAGVVNTPFSEVFDVQGVVLLKPTNMTLDKWTTVLDKARAELGKPYDTLFDISTDQALSCVELVRTALMAEPEYFANFANFEALIKKRGNLTPQMFYDCPDFEVVLEIRR
jgi:Permuted papain-like amidase enzyme, YaeF/YiiX, C92 family